MRHGSSRELSDSNASSLDLPFAKDRVLIHTTDWGRCRWADHRSVDFEIIGEIAGVETIAVGAGVRNSRRLRKRYGAGRWRKCKGFAKVRLPSGQLELAEIHWYEATDIGKREFKIKRYL
jgi:hypothetical protein